MEYRVTIQVETEARVKATVVVGNDFPISQKDMDYLLVNLPLAYSLPLSKQLKENS
jgi:hypothetical protein